MKDKNSEKIKIILLGLIAIILLCLLIVISLKFKEDNKHINEVGNSDKNSGVTETITDQEDTASKKEENNPEVEDNSATKNQDDFVGNEQSSVDNSEDVTYQESDVVAYFEDLNQNIKTYHNTNNTSMKDKIKNGFITIVDFLFYDGVIKGYTFDELTNETKIKVLTLALKIDNKIDEYIPNYKESIKDKATAFKEKVALLYLETTAKLCESVGEDSCNLARENFKDMKESFGFTWDGIKKVASTSASKLTTLLKEWYQSIKD